MLECTASDPSKNLVVKLLFTRRRARAVPGTCSRSPKEQKVFSREMQALGDGIGVPFSHHPKVGTSHSSGLGFGDPLPRREQRPFGGHSWCHPGLG